MPLYDAPIVPTPPSRLPRSKIHSNADRTAGIWWCQSGNETGEWQTGGRQLRELHDPALPWKLPENPFDWTHFLQIHIYDLEAVKKNTNTAIDWEAELEDPRWYTNPKPTVQTIPKTNSKENIVKEDVVPLAKEPQEPEGVPAKRPRSPPTTRRTILTSQQQRRSRACLTSPQPPAVKMKKAIILVPTVLEDLKRLQDTEKKERIPEAPPAPVHPVRSLQSRATGTTQSTSQLVPMKFSPASKLIIPVSSRISEVPEPPKTPEKPVPTITSKSTPPLDGTQKILNKLRACGVEVKRASTQLNATTELNPTKNQETLDIMRKLQSKGIRCTKVRKS